MSLRYDYAVATTRADDGAVTLSAPAPAGPGSFWDVAGGWAGLARSAVDPETAGRRGRRRGFRAHRPPPLPTRLPDETGHHGQPTWRTAEVHPVRPTASTGSPATRADMLRKKTS